VRLKRQSLVSRAVHPSRTQKRARAKRKGSGGTQECARGALTWVVLGPPGPLVGAFEEDEFVEEGRSLLSVGDSSSYAANPATRMFIFLRKARRALNAPCSILRSSWFVSKC
jgi:hypothetical protein